MTKANCPLCKNECSTVSRNVIDESVKKYFKKHINSREYGFCQNPDCDIVYFGLESDEIYFNRDLNEDDK
jgi:hypothetical protein